MKFKVVVDTNLLIAAFYKPNSASAQIVNMIARRDLIFIWSEAIQKEILTMLEKAQVKTKFINKIKNKVLRPEHMVEPTVKIKEVREDPDDNKFLEAAVAGGADYIITNDQHLLKLREFRDIPIFMPTDFWRIIKS